jgi:hypothetical protein
LADKSRPTDFKDPSVDRLELGKSRPAKTSLVRQLGRVGLGILGLSGAILGTAGVVSAVHQLQESCSCETVVADLKPVFTGNVQDYSDALVRHSFQRVPDCEGHDRLETGRLLKTEDGRVKYDGSNVVIIAFDGTFGHEPRRVPVMQELSRDLQARGIDTQSSDFLPADIVGRSITTATGRPVRWSGLSHGILQHVVRDPELNQNTQILTFPSEEFDVLANKSGWKDFEPLGFSRQLYGTAVDRPQNVEAALQSIVDIHQQAQELGRSPKFVILSYSSGGTSAVKLAERIQSTLGDDIRIDLVSTIDPVKEAHFAAGEAVGELAQEGAERLVGFLTDRLGGVPTMNHTPTVRSRFQPETLRATGNVEEWINFYQTSDILGIKAGPQLGIQGSPVSQAENVSLDELGSGGHGTIAIDARVVDRLLQELRERALPTD